MPETPAFPWRTIALVSLLPIVLIGVLLALVLRGGGDPAERCRTLTDDAEAGECWIRLAMDTKDFSLCSNIADDGYRALCSHDAEYTGGSSSSSAVSSSMAAAAASSTTVTASSTPSVAFTGPIAPFDGCPGFFKYMSHDWFTDVEQQLDEQGITPEFEIEEACLSADYLIVVMRGDAGAAPVLRYDVHSHDLLWATQGDGEARRAVASFGKRDGDLIPLMLNNCRSGTYDVRTNTVTSDGENCEDVVCSGGLGDDEWPSSPKYKHLTHLGPIFTAADCGDARLKEVHPKATYAVGSTIFLGVHPSAAFEQELIAAGYSCDDGACLTWRNQSKSIPLSSLLRLRPFVGEMKGDDCYYCG